MSIEFTQFMLPHGERRERLIDRPAEIEAKAEQVVQSGGRFECEVLTTGDVSLSCVAEVDGEPGDIAIVVVPNGAGVPEAIDRLVEKAAAWFEQRARRCGHCGGSGVLAVYGQPGLAEVQCVCCMTEAPVQEGDR